MGPSSPAPLRLVSNQGDSGLLLAPPLSFSAGPGFRWENRSVTSEAPSDPNSLLFLLGIIIVSSY